jgi:hypothetical protein
MLHRETGNVNVKLSLCLIKKHATKTYQLINEAPRNIDGNLEGSIIQFSDCSTGWTTGIKFPVGDRDFSLNHCVHTSTEAHTVSHPRGTGVFFRRR